MKKPSRLSRTPQLLKIFILTVAVVLFAVPSWAWKAEHKQGLKFLKAGAYEQAIEQFESALKDEKLDDKKRAQIETDLQQAKLKAAEAVFQRAQQFSAKNEIANAIKAFAMAAEYDPSNAGYAQRLAQEKEKISGIEAKVSKSVELGETQHQWDQALKELETYRIYESSFPEISGRIEESKTKAAEFYVSQSDQELGNQNYQNAYNNIEKAAAFNEAQTIQNKKRARHHLLMSEQAWKDKQYLKAYEEISKGLEFEPENPDLLKYRGRFFDEWLGLMYNEAVQASNDGRYGVAKSRLQQISQVNPGFMNTEELLSEVRSTLASTSYDKANSILASGDRSQIGIALANFLAAQQEHSSLFPDIEEKIQEAKRLLNKELEYRISVDFKNSSQEPSAAGLVREQLLAKMKNHAALKNITILDREAIDDILREQGLGQGFLDETTALEVKKIKGIQAGIKGEVIKVEVKETGRERPSYGSARYVSGTRWVPNPDYMRVQSDVQASQQYVLQAQTNLNEAQRQQNQMMAQQQQQNLNTANNPFGALAAGLGQMSTGLAEGDLRKAQNNLSAAQMELARTPQQIEEEIYSDYRYEIFDLKLNAEAVISFKIVNYTTSEIGQVHTIRETDSAADRYIPGDPGKNVASDPIDLPPPDEFKNKILNQAVDKTFDALVAELSVRAEDYYKVAKKAENSRIVDDAVENYIRYIYSSPDLGSDKVQEANEYIYEQVGISVIRRKS